MTTTNYNVQDDTFTSTTSTGSNYGTQPYLAIGGNFRGWFKVPAYTVPAGEIVEKVELVLTRTSTDTASTYTVSRVNATWGETTITHANQPATTVVNTVNDPGGAVGSQAVIDITQAVSQTNYGVQINRATQGNAESAESGNTNLRPFVRVTTVAGQVLDITEDGMVLSGASANNYGQNAVNNIGNYQDTTKQYRTFFKLPAPTLGAGETVTSAKLRFTRYSAVASNTVAVSRVNADWSEATITYDNRPAVTFVKNATDPGGSANDALEIDVTDAYDPNYGVELYTTDILLNQFHSSEATTTSYRPQVVYTTAVSAGTPVTVSAAPMTASATIPETYAGDGESVVVTDDAHTIGTTTTNYGTSTTLQLGSDRKTYFKAAKPALTATEVLDYARLVFVVSNGTYNINSNVEVRRIDAAWDESTITGANAPATTLLATVPLVVSGTTGTVVKVDVSSWVNDTTNEYGIMLHSPSSANFYVHSTEATSGQPRIEVKRSVVANAGFTTTPATAVASMPESTTSASKTVSVGSTPMTATATTPNATGTSDVAPLAGVLAASAIMTDASAGTITEVVSEPLTATALVTPAGVSVERNANFTATLMEATADLGADSGYSMPLTYNVSGAAGAHLEGTIASVATTKGVMFKSGTMSATARWIQPMVMDKVIVANEADDRYFQRVIADKPRIYFRLNGKGSRDENRGSYRSDLGLLYHGVIPGQNGPDGRHSLYFDGTASLEQEEISGTSMGGDESTPVNSDRRLTTAFEVSLKTTKKDQFLFAGRDLMSGTIDYASGPNTQFYLSGGKMKMGDVTAFTDIADGEWHTIVIRYNVYRYGSWGSEVWIDGKFEIRRSDQRQFGLWGFPDWIGSRPTIIDNNSFGELPSSMNFVGDMSEASFYGGDEVLTDDDISRHYYDFMGWVPVAAENMDASASMPQGASARGNQKRALYLYFSGAPSRDTYQFKGDGGNNKPNHDPFPDMLEYTVGGDNDFTPVKNWNQYKVFAMPIRPTVGDLAYRDAQTDAPRLISLKEDVNIDDFDLIMFKDWPDDSQEREANKNGIARLLEELRWANNKGVGLMVTHPQLAVDLGIVDRVEWTPSMREQARPDEASGTGVSLYDYGSAAKFPWNIADYNGLEGNVWLGSSFNGQPMNTDPDFLAHKATFYGDTNKNDRFRVRALIEGLTDLPSWMINDAVFHVEGDEWGWNAVAYKYIERPEGLRIGDEFIFHGSDFGKTPLFVGTSANPIRFGRWYGTWGVPLANVKAGTVVTTFGSTLWQRDQLVDNPYKDYATTIVLRPGDNLAGKPVGGKIFVNFSEQPSYQPDAVPVDILPEEGEEWPNSYKPDTEAQREWQFSFTRTSLNTVGTQIKSSYGMVMDASGEMRMVANRMPSSSVTHRLFMTTSNAIFDRKYAHSFQMVRRGAIWLAERVEHDPGANTQVADSLDATAEIPSPTVVAERDVTVTTAPAVALAQMPRVEESTIGDVEVRTLPATATATITGYGKTIGAEPMTAAAELVENFDMVHASGEQVVLTLHGVDATLYLREEVN